MPRTDVWRVHSLAALRDLHSEDCSLVGAHGGLFTRHRVVLVRGPAASVEVLIARDAQIGQSTLVLVLTWRRRQHVRADDAGRPCCDLERLFPAHVRHHLEATAPAELLRTALAREAKVSKADLAFIIDKDAARLQVPVHDAQLVKELQTAEQVVSDHNDLVLAEGFGFLHDFLQVLASHVKNEEKAVKGGSVQLADERCMHLDALLFCEWLHLGDSWRQRPINHILTETAQSCPNRDRRVINAPTVAILALRHLLQSSDLFLCYLIRVLL